jgi:lipopolysaccharide/colanic/teichoic acid biosynthesis glycosyltransferase
MFQPERWLGQREPVLFRSFENLSVDGAAGAPSKSKRGGASRSGADALMAPGGFNVSRVFDCTIATVALVLFGPVMLAITLAIVLLERGAVIYRHERVGLGGRKFVCLKFRTMYPDGDHILQELLARDEVARAEWDKTQKLRKDPRVTRIGRVLRATSFDELPQIFNVFAGNMAIVGPRPVVSEELRHYRRYARHYMAVRPGITGLWQVSGRNSTSYRRRVACDVKYVRSKSLANDLNILLRTVPVILIAHGAY